MTITQPPPVIIDRAAIKALTESQLTCPLSGDPLDYRTAVAIISRYGTMAFLVSHASWCRIKKDRHAVARLAEKGYTVPMDLINQPSVL